ncbi:putative COP9 signalosome complex subunit 2 [Globomyces pollinis-pini]|nr:putative COP9 signalosome complex subunit 2 [Globomyces pollinis-pini]
MSDDDDFMQEDEEFDFQYSGSEEETEDMDLENLYYEAKGIKQNDPHGAIKELQKVVQGEPEKAEWGFKALKQIIKISFKLGDYETCLKNYIELLTYVKSAVTRNTSEKAINSILDYSSTAQDMLFMENLFSITLKTLEDTKNDRLWTKTNLKLAKLWLDKEEYGRLKKIIRTLHESCKNVDGSSDQQKGTLLLEIYALEIQLYTTTKNNKKLKEVYQQCLIVKSAIPHPRIMGLIRECGGKMHMYEKEWEKAQTDFFEAFKNYDEAGSPQRIQCLRYLVLANMLMESQINPFDSQETKPYAGDPQIVMLTNLVEAFQSKDIKRFETILRQNHSSIMNDSFIREYIDDVLKNIRMQVVQKLAKPYTRIKLSFISEQLNITPEIAEDLLISLILDGRVKGKIDQINQIVELEQESSDSSRYTAMSKWVKETKNLYGTVAQRIQ